ncbi:MULTISPECIES: iron uptake porin [Calothrix]|uniref:Carbohydrate porin n=2 Tax=Calothrix TaxID=1186 RepID=A0ABR8A5B3_9CYAN|nr:MULTISPECIES: iron uptake porin [Calothrix]MBD2195152.1 carbohydrate porin [Calothrix parietina FACHB-288]MBD2223877.1 carbohydrate porin [Calothrix anomala FACHB-343]
MRSLKFLGKHRSVYRQILLTISAILVYQILPTSIQVLAKEVNQDATQSVTEQKALDGQGIDELLFFSSLSTTVNSSQTVSQGQNRQKIIAQTTSESPTTPKPSSLPALDSNLLEPANADEQENDPMAQVTNISQLQDVQPTDWAFSALQSLVERYGCIAGYPNGTFRGDRALTRYEFAAGLNACLDRINELIGTATQELVTKQDLETLKRLQEEFATELATLRGRVDALEARTTELEANQFSTTTKLFGNLRVQTNAYFSGDGNPQTNIQYNFFLGLLTSFTGRDLLFTGLGATSTAFPELATNNNGRDVGSTREGSSDTTGSGDSFSNVRILGLEYQFPIGDNLLINVIAANRYRFSPVLLSQFLPYYTIGRGPISAFAEAPPIYLVGAGTGISASYKIVDSTVLTLTYQGTFANESQAGGLFNGDYVAAAQVNYNPNPGLFLQALYQHGYFNPGNFGFHSGQTFRGNGFVGSALANRFDDAGVLFDEASAVSTNAYQIGGYFAISPKVVIGGWANLIQARLIGKGDADIWTYSIQAAFPDLFRKGNQGGLIVGMEPTLTGVRTSLPYAQFKNDTSLHIEAYYRHQLSEQISISPSVIWITSPNQDANNEDIVIGGIRTTFNF